MMLPGLGSATFRYLVYAALIIIIILGIRTAAWFVNIIIIAIILAMLATPAVALLNKKEVPDLVAVTLVTICACLIIFALVMLMFYSLHILIQDLPLYQEQLNQRIAEISSIMQSFGIDTTSLRISSPDLSSIVNIFLPSIMKFSDLIVYLFFIGVTAFFLLLEIPHLEKRVKTIFEDRADTFSEVSRLSRFMVEFIIVRTETNIVHGVVFGSALYAMGVHSALLWGTLTFLLSYIPYVGLVIAAIPAIFFAYIQFGIWGAVAVIALVCILNLLIENPVFSYFASKKFEIPAFLVITSTLFWGWVLGFFGFVFAIPITLMVLIIIQCSDECRWVNVLLGVDQLFAGTNPDKKD
jgi:predicted PurR-regulated permease PerM